MRRTLALLAVALLPLAGVAVPTEAAAPDRGAVDRARPNAMFFGDSYFVGGGCSPDRNRDMAAVAGRSLGYRPTVRGAGGTGFVAANPDYDLPPYLAQIEHGALDVKNPQLVVIQGGSNDVGLSTTAVRTNARKILAIARQKYPQARLALVGPMDTYGGYADSVPIRNALRSVARRMHVPFIDAMKWTQGHDEWLCDDYVHPTYAGHVELGAKLAAALRKRGA